jgi:hypothetical protein
MSRANWPDGANYDDIVCDARWTDAGLLVSAVVRLRDINRPKGHTCFRWGVAFEGNSRRSYAAFENREKGGFGDSYKARGQGDGTFEIDKSICANSFGKHADPYRV